MFELFLNQVKFELYIWGCVRRSVIRIGCQPLPGIQILEFSVGRFVLTAALCLKQRRLAWPGGGGRWFGRSGGE